MDKYNTYNEKNIFDRDEFLLNRLNLYLKYLDDDEREDFIQEFVKAAKKIISNIYTVDDLEDWLMGDMILSDIGYKKLVRCLAFTTDTDDSDWEIPKEDSK